ncbi:MAG TPA: hypothetical protein VMF88_01000 [Bacteroidota bacterium]|nr:hypothetical protein [Bacteroidota bacterium]
MKSLHRIIFVILFSVPFLAAYAQENTKLQGAWELTSQKIDGQEKVLSGRRIRLITASHFAWVKQDTKMVKELLAKGTAHDSAVAFHDVAGAGTYKVNGDTYTETTEFFYDPQNLGSSIDWKYKLEGNLWYTSGHYIHYKDGKKNEDLLIEEVWKKIE